MLVNSSVQEFFSLFLQFEIIPPKMLQKEKRGHDGDRGEKAGLWTSLHWSPLTPPWMMPETWWTHLPRVPIFPSSQLVPAGMIVWSSFYPRTFLSPYVLSIQSMMGWGGLSLLCFRDKACGTVALTGSLCGATEPGSSPPDPSGILLQRH